MSVFEVQSQPGWTGSLLLSARPRGWDWLEDEVADWKRQSVDIVVSLLMPYEAAELGLVHESDVVQQHGIHFVNYPIEDRHIPVSPYGFHHLASSIDLALRDDKNVLLHCRQGIGRTGLVAACVLTRAGIGVTEATDHLTAIRGVPVPETEEQKEWLEKFCSW